MTWDVDVDNTIILKLIEMKNNSEYLIGYLDDIIRPLVLILVVSRFIKTFKVKSTNLFSLHLDDENLLKRYKAILTKIESFKKINLILHPFMMIDI